MKRFSKRLWHRLGRYFGAGNPEPTTERPLVTESLEQRMLLTTYVDLQLDVTNTAGTPLSSVEAGGSFELRGYVQDTRDDVLSADMGLATAFLDIQYDNSLLSAQGTKILNWPYLYEPGGTFDFQQPGLIKKAAAGVSDSHLDPVGDGEFLMFRIPLTADGGTPVDAVDDDHTTDPALRIGAGSIPHTFHVLANDTIGGETTFTGQATAWQSYITSFDEPYGYPSPAVPPDNINYGEVTIEITPSGTPFIWRAGPSGGPGASNLSDKGGTVQIVNAGQQISYTPPESMNSLGAGESDTDTFRYKVTDGSGGTDTATVTVTIVGSSPTQLDISLKPATTRVHSVTGEVAAVPGSRTWLDEWENYWVEIWVSTPLSDNVGIASASVDLSYDTTYYTATLVQPGPGFAASFSHDPINDIDGEILNITGTTSAGNIGDDGVAQLARVRFKRMPVDAEVTNNAIGQYGSPVATLTTELTRYEAALDPPGDALPSGTTGPVSVDLWPVMYDLTDDDAVNFSDLAFFAAVFLQRVTDNDNAYASDFDHSGKVDFGDFAFFAPNFGQRKGSTKPRDYAAGFPDDWGATLSVAAGAVPSRDAAPLTDSQLTAVVDAAVARLEPNLDEEAATGTFSDVTVEIVDLPGNLVGLAQANERRVQIDVDAAGYGWFVDATPLVDEEFSVIASTSQRSTLPASAAAPRVDLLTVVMHELGHLLGHDDDDGHSLMQSTLPTGTRRLADFAAEGETDSAALDQVFAGLDVNDG